MTSAKETEAQLPSATVRQLSEQGYDVVFQPSGSLLPAALQRWRPDAIAIGALPAKLGAYAGLVEATTVKNDDAAIAVALLRGVSGGMELTGCALGPSSDDRT